jgi:hypothetical protein
MRPVLEGDLVAVAGLVGTSDRLVLGRHDGEPIAPDTGGLSTTPLNILVYGWYHSLPAGLKSLRSEAFG